MTNWRRLTFYGAKTHIVPEELAQDIIDDMSRRKCELESDESVTSCGIDQPGMIATNRPIMDFIVPGLAIVIPCEDVATFAIQCDEYRQRGKYFKMHGYLMCIVFIPEHFKQFTKLLTERTLEAETKARAFWAGRKVYSEVLADASGTPYNVNLGGNKIDRFKTPKNTKGPN